MTAHGEIDLDAIVRDVCEWADRGSPDYATNHLLITPGELKGVLEEAVDLARQAQQPAGGLDGAKAAIEAAGGQWSAGNEAIGDYWASVRAKDRDYWHRHEGPTPLAALTAAAKEAGIPIPPRAANKPAPEAWIIVYDDSDEENEHFVGHGATEAALKRFEGRKVAWNCHLFRCVASA